MSSSSSASSTSSAPSPDEDPTPAEILETPGHTSGHISYWFAEAIHMDEFVERKYPNHIRKLKSLLQKYQLPIIIGWSFMMFLPTDLICYVCGTLRINFTKFILCLLIGVPIGIWAAENPRVGRVTAAVCDTLQTFPSFIYLIPMVMLFRVGDFSAMIAVILIGLASLILQGLNLGIEFKGGTAWQVESESLSVDDVRNMTPAVWLQMDRLNRISDKLYIHIDMDVLDPREVMAHGNKVPNGPSSEQLARLFEEIFRRYPKASAIGFATIPMQDEGGLSIAALNRMIEGAVKGVKARETKR